MPAVTTTADIKAFMESEDKEEAREALGIPDSFQAKSDNLTTLSENGGVTDRRASLAKWRAGIAADSASIAFIGDSWVGNKRITDVIRDTLQAEFGTGGDGWASVVSQDGMSTNTALGTSGTWTHTVHPTAGLGLDGYDAVSSDTTPAIKFLETASDRYCTFYYLIQPGGGSFTTEIDSAGQSAPISTAGTLALGNLTLDGGTIGHHYFTIRITTAGSSGVRILGSHVWRTAGKTGVRLHSIGHSSASSGYFASVSASAIWRAQLTDINPSVLVIMLGINDQVQERTVAAYIADMETLIANAKAAVPDMGIVLMTQTDAGYMEQGYGSLLPYLVALSDLAQEEGYLFVDTYSAMGAFNLGSNADSYPGNHPDAATGALIAQPLVNALRSVGPLPSNANSLNAPIQVPADWTVADDAYDATTWNGNLTVPTKNAIRDKIEGVLAGPTLGKTTISAANGADALLRLQTTGAVAAWDFEVDETVGLKIQHANSAVVLFTISPAGVVSIPGVPVYANNAAAITGGLSAGMLYRTGADPDPVCRVH